MVATDTSAPFTASFDTKTVADGAAPVVATAVDTSGLSASTSTVNVTIDNTKPGLTVGGPNGATFGPGTTQNWTIAATDPASGLFQVRCSLVTAGSPASSAPCSGGNVAHSATGKPHGSYVLTVRATDNAGNVTEVVRTFSIDAIAPETTIDCGVEDGATTTATSLTWAMSASEAGVDVRVPRLPGRLDAGRLRAVLGGRVPHRGRLRPGRLHVRDPRDRRRRQRRVDLGEAHLHGRAGSAAARLTAAAAAARARAARAAARRPPRALR